VAVWGSEEGEDGLLIGILAWREGVKRGTKDAVVQLRSYIKISVCGDKQKEVTWLERKVFCVHTDVYTIDTVKYLILDLNLFVMMPNPKVYRNILKLPNLQQNISPWISMLYRHWFSYLLQECPRKSEGLELNGMHQFLISADDVES